MERVKPHARVVLVDDDPMVRAGLRLLLESEFDVIGEADCAAVGIARTRELRPDLVLMDLRMPGGSGVDAIAEIDRQETARAVVALTTFRTDELLFGALGAGAAGFLLKDTEPARLRELLHRALEGETVLSPGIIPRVVSASLAARPDAHALNRLEVLTPREREIAELIGDGLANAEIARKLHLAVPTVKAHITAIHFKLETPSRVALALLVERSR